MTTTPDDRVAAPCAVGAAAEPLAGTAPSRRVWALVEHPGPWGRDAPLDAPWPSGLGAALQRAADAADVRLVLARRHRTRPAGGPPEQPHVVLAVTGPGGWVAQRRLDGPQELPDLDWAALACGTRPAGWADPGPVWAVCTHGTRDACCARMGRPLAQAFTAVAPEHTWEMSHTGGHRFAGVVLALPEGCLYGRVTARDVDRLVAARKGGDVVPGLLRGRTHLSPWQQAAEAALREHLGEARLDAFTPEGVVCDGPTARTTWRHAGGGRWQVDVREVAIPDRPASCGKPAEPATSWRPATPTPLHLPPPTPP